MIRKTKIGMEVEERGIQREWERERERKREREGEREWYTHTHTHTHVSLPPLLHECQMLYSLNKYIILFDSFDEYTLCVNTFWPHRIVAMTVFEWDSHTLGWRIQWLLFLTPTSQLKKWFSPEQSPEQMFDQRSIGAATCFASCSYINVWFNKTGNVNCFLITLAYVNIGKNVQNVVEITTPLEFILQIIWLHSKWITGSSREQEFQPQHEFTSLFSQPWGHLERWRRGLDFLLLLLLLCRRSHAIRRTTMCASGVTSCSLFLYNFLSKRATRAKGQVSPWRSPREGQGWNITFTALW